MTVKEDVEGWWVRFCEIEETAHTKAQRWGSEVRLGKLEKELGQIWTLSLESLFKISVSPPPRTQGKGLEMQLSTVDIRKAGGATNTVFRQKRATSGVTVNQHIRKPTIQPLLRTKAIRYGPSVGNFLKYELVSCTISYRESWIPFPSLPLA